MNPLSMPRLLSWAFRELEAEGSIFGIPRSLCFRPQPGAPYASRMFGHDLATPVGPAAGPHTQLAQNIVCAWLSGARFIELKTVQIMDELEIPRPCIDMADEGYNVEWSQELRLEQSAREYIHAWVLLHVLHEHLGFQPRRPIGVIFNMSVGYNLAGIRSAPMLRFMDRLQDATDEIAEMLPLRYWRGDRMGLAPLRENIPEQIVNSVTLSTMHGCPPDEIEAIARFLMEERGLHTTVKLNPTLLGQDEVMRILHDDLGYREIRIPDSVFAHDLQYERAVRLIRTLQGVAAGKGLTFGVKLSNTLAMANHRGVLPGDEMYMSGRALYPITLALFRRLMHEFDGDLNVSFSAGADALNVVEVLACGARPVTAASDLLKPGGYSRVLQWLEEIEAAMRARRAGSLEELSQDRMAHLERAAAGARRDRRYHKSACVPDLPKVDSGLGLFDCIAAPCSARCAVCQDVPEYAWLIARGDYDRALRVILHRNPLPAVTGYVCTHLCQSRCTRNNYDEAVGIRDLKRFAAERGRRDQGARNRYQVPDSSYRVAVVGSGPSGLSAAFFLALSGVRVTILEAHDVPGGMLALAGRYRLPAEAVQADIDRILGLGVELRLNHRVEAPPQALLGEGFDAVYLACGLQRDAALDVPGIDGEGVWGALRFLEAVARGEAPALGDEVLVVGGGNTAMDVARTAARLTGRPVTVVYRRSRAEMPADEEEIEGLLAEGNRIEELAAPVRAVREGGRLVALECVRTTLGEPGADGRRQPVPVPGGEFRLPASAILLAVGQAPDLAFLEGSGLAARRDGTLVTDPESRITTAPRVYAGGDLARGPAIIIEACEDGRRAAEAICRSLGLEFRRPPAEMPALGEEELLQVKRARARREARQRADVLPVEERAGFALVEQSLSEAEARAEAARCLQCSVLCDKCVEVCPNRANLAYRVEPVRASLPLLECRGGALLAVAWEEFAVAQSRQIVHVDDLCNECGNCATFCVHQGRPYADKPRLFLDEAGFLAEGDNAFYLEGESLRRREGGREARLTRLAEGYEYEEERLRARLSAGLEVREQTLLRPFEGIASLRPAAEMAVLLEGIRRSLPFLAGCREPEPPVYEVHPER